jgi:hypothetical protein
MLRLREVTSQDERSRSVRSKRKTKSVTKMKGMEAYRPKGEVFFLDRPPLLAVPASSRADIQFQITNSRSVTPKAENFQIDTVSTVESLLTLKRGQGPPSLLTVRFRETLIIRSGFHKVATATRSANFRELHETAEIDEMNERRFPVIAF